MRRVLGVLAVVLVIAAAGCSSSRPSPVGRAHQAQPVTYIGVVLNSPTPARLRQYGDSVGKQPNIVEYYEKWGRPFPSGLTKQVASTGAMPMVSWEPTGTTMADIAAGKSDYYLVRWALAVKAYGKPIAISFAAEMNGHWEDWGPTRATPAQYVAAWRHVHEAFTSIGATNVTWVWTPNVINGLNVPLAPYWPGSAYVDWVGMDGYWWGPTSKVGTTFDQIFGPTLASVRSFTNKPVLIAETAGANGEQLAAVEGLFYGLQHTKGMLGFIWFDLDATGHAWQLTDESALSTFRSDSYTRAPDHVRG